MSLDLVHVPTAEPGPRPAFLVLPGGARWTRPGQEWLSTHGRVA